MALIELTLNASLSAVPIDIAGTTAVNAETFNGAIPGPTISLTVGDTLVVRLINDMPWPVGIHWHGLELENYSDGTEVTQEEVPGAPLQTLVNGVPAGGTFLYKFNVPKAGIFWYHPHHHHSTNRVFRGLYGMIIVADAAEVALVGSGVLPPVLPAQQIVLSDITVCKAIGFNDASTYVDPTTVVPATDAAEWLSGVTVQNGPAPVSLCELDPLDEHGMSMMVPPYTAGEIPVTFRMVAAPGIPPTVEGQTVLTNGRNVGYRLGTPSAPGALEPGFTSISVQPGQGVRFQIVNTATTRYFRLRLTTSTGVLIPLVRVGGEGGILNDAITEGGTIGTLNTKYSVGEILLPAAARADVIAVIPIGTTGVCTMWTRDYQRVGGVNPGGWSQLPTVPVLHLTVVAPAVPLFTMVNGTPLKSSIAASTPGLGAATGILLDPATFAPAKPGMSNQEIQLTVSGGGVNGINGIQGNFEGFTPYSTIPKIASTRWAKAGDILQLKVKNATGAHHPFHLHGFSFQPISFEPNGAAVNYTFPYVEFRDTIDIPSQHTLTLKVHISGRPLADGVTPGGALGRWLFHCHIFFHAHHGMIGEIVITDPDGTGSEKPNVNVHGSWAYAPSGGVATRTGTYFHFDGDPITLTTSLGNVNDLGSGNWSWQNLPGTPDQITYVYVTATDSSGRKDQCVFRLNIGGALDASDVGDPHIHTVDGKAYDFQAAGEFTLLKDREGLEVQARQTPVLTANPITDWYTGLKSCVSVNTAVAARVGKHRIAYQPTKEPGQYIFYVDGKRASLPPRGLNIDGNHVRSFSVNGVTGLRVDYVNSAVLVVTPLFWSSNNVWYLDIRIARTGADEGIMGAIPANTWLPLLPNGASVGAMPPGLDDRFHSMYKTFADAWRVNDNTSMFVYEPGTSTATFTDRNWPARDLPCKLLPQFEIPGWVIPQGMDMEKAKQFCEIVTDEGLNRDCVFDVATTGDEGIARNYRITQDMRERSTAVQLVIVKPGFVTAIVSPMVQLKQDVPKGTVVFLVDDKEAGDPVRLDEQGHATWPVGGLKKGTSYIRAEYTPADPEIGYASGSPNLEITESDRTKPNTNSNPATDPVVKPDPKVTPTPVPVDPTTITKPGGIFQRWYFWAVLAALIALLIWWYSKR